MDISGEYTFEVPQALVWDALRDPNVLGAVVPGGQGFQEVGENQYTGVLLIKVGPVQGTFQGKIELKDIVPPESYTIDVDGKGQPGFVKATGAIKLHSHGDNETHMEYSGTAQVGGRIASVGQRLIDSSARSIIRQSLEALNEYLKVEAAKLQIEQAAANTAVVSASTGGDTAPATTAPTTAAPVVPSYKPPSQMKLMTTVMRDVFNDMIPPKYQPILFVAVIAIIALIIWLISRG